MRREGVPPPALLSSLISHWRETWPNADLGLEAVRRIYPWIVQKWQEGWTLDRLAGSACKCVGDRIEPSDAANRPVPRRQIALPPPNAEDGIPFGAEDLQDAPTIKRLKTTIEVADLRRQEMALQVAILQKRIQGATSPDAQQKLRERIAVIEQQARAEQQRKEDAEAKLAALKAGTSRSQTPKAPKAPKAAKEKRATTEKKPTEKRPTEKKPMEKKPKAERKAKTDKQPTAEKNTSTEFDMNATEDLVAQLLSDEEKDGK